LPKPRRFLSHIELIIDISLHLSTVKLGRPALCAGYRQGLTKRPSWDRLRELAGLTSLPEPG